MAPLKQPKLMARIPKERDLEAHVRIQHVFGDDILEIRDYIPSTKTYSRGFVIDIKQLPRLNEELQRIEEERFGRTAPIAAGQGTLFQ